MLLAHHVRNLVSVTSTNRRSAQRADSTCSKGLRRVRDHFSYILHSDVLKPFSPDALTSKNIQTCNSLASSVLFVRPSIIACSTIKVFHRKVLIILYKIRPGALSYGREEEKETVVDVVQNCQKRSSAAWFSPSRLVLVWKEPQISRSWLCFLFFPHNHSCVL